MSDTIIEVDNISKLYKLGSLGTGTLSHDLNRWWSKLRKKDDPDILAGEVNDRTKAGGSNFVWSLKDISFSINEGEIFGIIGSNGAGKSTLLKILSKITKPTTGSIKIGGKIASLLEVGTGFHPELTGHENVYLNGAILGMRKQEIKQRFDEIVEFSGVGRYINTPVKKYSSGMYVRLAFAVAAHLEPDILIVDEVLAVGDAEFQAKCMGKMKDVSMNKGRTVLFVSHSVPAIKKMCSKAMLLEKGMQKAIGDTEDILALYQHREEDKEDGIRKTLPHNVSGCFTDWKLEDTRANNNHTCYTGDSVVFSFGFMAHETMRNCEAAFALKYDGLLLLNTSNLSGNGSNFTVTPGYHRFRFKLDFPIRDSRLEVEARFYSLGKQIDKWESTTKLTVLDNFNTHHYAGLINPDIEFSIANGTATTQKTDRNTISIQ